MTRPLHIALAGNPNAGKTTLFNYLTGARQHVGNYPGVTVDKKTGACRHNDVELLVTDLPGTYSLTAYLVEELVALDFLVNEKPDVVLNIVDASNIERNLYLTCQFMELGVPVVIALNMIDVARSRGVEIDADKLSGLLRAPVVPIIARSGKGVAQLLETVVAVGNDRARQWQPLRLSYGEDLDQALEDMIPSIEESRLLTDIYPARWTGLKILLRTTSSVASHGTGCTRRQTGQLPGVLQMPRRSTTLVPRSSTLASRTATLRPQTQTGAWERRSLSDMLICMLRFR